jgi:hypothetical protein
MSFDYDLDDELDNQHEVTSLDDDYESEFDEDEMSFEDIDFEALGIDPGAPTAAKPGSEEKVLMLAARYAAGVPLWHDRDCYDHGPGELSSRLFIPPQPKN